MVIWYFVDLMLISYRYVSLWKLIREQATKNIRLLKQFGMQSIIKIFVELCYDEILKGNKPWTSFNKDRWTNLVSYFEKKKQGNLFYEAN